MTNVMQQMPSLVNGYDLTLHIAVDHIAVCQLFKQESQTTVNFVQNSVYFCKYFSNFYHMTLC